MVAAAVGLALLSVWKSAAQRDERTEAAHRLQMLTAEPIAGVIGDHADEAASGGGLGHRIVPVPPRVLQWNTV